MAFGRVFGLGGGAAALVARRRAGGGGGRSGRFALPQVLFSQLGGIVHGMLEFGLEQSAVQDFVDSVCADHGLSQEEHALITSHIAMKAESEQF